MKLGSREVQMRKVLAVAALSTAVLSRGGVPPVGQAGRRRRHSRSADGVRARITRDVAKIAVGEQQA